MDWPSLITHNFDKLLIFLSGVTGVILGGGITYFVQSRLQETQRRWALDDQRRKGEREALERFEGGLDEIHTSISFIAMRQREVTQDDKEYIYKELAKTATNIPPLFVIENQILLDEWAGGVAEFIESGEDTRYYTAHWKVKRYVLETREETYSPPQSPFQRLVKWLRLKRQQQ